MRTTRFMDILEGVAKRLGVTPGTESWTEQFVGELVEWVNRWVKIGWEYTAWPECMLVEERYYLPEYDNATAYGIGAQVYYGGGYWEGLTAGNTGNLPAESAYWTALTDYDRVISLDQAGLTPIGTVFSVSQRNPDKSTSPFFLGYTMTGDGIQLSSLAPTSVFVKFRTKSPVFTDVEWDAAETYAVGDLVLGSDGECYVAKAAVAVNLDPAGGGNGTYWTKVGFPTFLDDFVKMGARSDGLRADGQDDKADGQEDKAFEALVRRLDVDVGQQDQTPRMRMAGYG